jgi:NAD(P)-dependent dehydrogenase (short-subunit alcohol dehydrogenase family)
MISKGSTILITGAARRVGAQMVRRFSEAGYYVALHYHGSEEEAEALAAETGASLYQGNLTERGATKKLIAKVMQDHPTLSGLINNASTFRRAHLSDSTEDSIAEDLTINLQAPLNLMREFAAQASADNRFIINMLDTAIYSTHPAHFAYLIAKKGLAEATKMAAREWIGKIRVNGICPGHVLPTEGDSSYDPKNRAVLPTVEQVVEAALLLAENHSYTGQFLNIDGGESIL